VLHQGDPQKHGPPSLLSVFVLGLELRHGSVDSTVKKPCVGAPRLCSLLGGDAAALQLWVPASEAQASCPRGARMRKTLASLQQRGAPSPRLGCSALRLRWRLQAAAGRWCGHPSGSAGAPQDKHQAGLGTSGEESRHCEPGVPAPMPLRGYYNQFPSITSFLIPLAVWAGKRDSGRACGRLAEQGEEQRTSENGNHIPGRTDTTQEDQPAAALEEGLGRGGFVRSATRGGSLHRGDQTHHLQLRLSKPIFRFHWSNWGKLPSACIAKI